MESIDDKELSEIIKRNIEENERLVQEKLKKQKQEKIMELLNRSGLGGRFKKRTFETYNTEGITKSMLYAYNKSLEFANNFPNVEKGLLFSGTVGTGKTHLAAAIVNKLVEDMYSVAFGNATEILTMIKSSYNKNSDYTEQDMIKLFTDDVDMLVIDDLGKENSTDNSIALIYQIINRLYEHEKPIIVTTNFTSVALRKKLGEKGDAIISRLAEMCEFIKISGEDWRMKNGTE